ncbi:Protein tyrosine kinase [Phytophthora infestans]|uniref:Protein tyrosine kinase n=1 Tax=Phytophthora infestans TaxID=4787 RepID=A0A8S9U6S7_PHYIN|nr:Protein tyrosine kinase [Phytophthora infestans]
MRLLVPSLALAVGGASAASSSSSSSVSWCSNSTSSAVLTYCGDVCTTGDPCVQYSSSSSCSEASRNDCVRHSSSCTYQCLDAYNSVAKKITVFVKEPSSSDTWTSSASGSSAAAFPSAEIDTVSGVEYAEATRNIQITGFDDTNVQKGSLKSVTFDEDTFATATVLEQLILTNLDLALLPSGFLPTTISLLTMENCNLATLPSQLGNLANKNLVTLNLNKNTMTSITDTDSSVTQALQGLTSLNLTDNSIATFDMALPSVTTLDLSNNKLTEFPSVIFDMANLNVLNIGGNSITSLTVTPTQYSFLRKLSSDSTLSVTASACSSGTATDVLDSVVCVSTEAASSSSSDGSDSSSSSTLIIVVVVLAVVVVLGVAGFFLYRRKMKNHGFYLSNTPDMVGVATPLSSNNTPARNRAGSRGRASSQQRPPTAGGRTPRSSIPNVLLAGFSDHGKKMSDAQPRRSSVQSTLPANGRQARSSIISSHVAQIPSDELNYTRKIAKGAFGEVWLALYGKDLVAVKKLITVEGTSVQDFVSELNLLASLSHRCILSLIGACWDDELTDIQIVMEYMDSGDLLSVLRKSPPSVLTWENGKATYCVQVCEAVYYLHSLQPALIHRDIKSRNILVDSQKGAKLSDFGESRERTVARTMTAGVGTARWVAPEIILGEDYSELADIYSLGVLLTEMDTHQIPYQTLGLEESMIVQQVAVGKLRPKVSDTCPEIIRRLTHECLQYDPSLRPSAARVLQTLMASPLVRRPSVSLADD